MRLLYFSREYTSHDYRFLSALSEAGEKVYYLTLEGRGEPLEDRALPAGVELLRWRGGRGKPRLADGPALLWDLKGILRRVKPDILQAGPLQTAGLLAALSGFQPLVSMSWGYDLLIDAQRNPLWRWATRYTLRHSAAMVGDCETIRKKAITYGMDADRIVTFPWGVDLEHFSPGEGAVNGDGITLLSTRGWEPIYGTDILARAFLDAARDHPDLYLVLMSNGSLAGKLRRMISEAGMDERVVFPGHASFNDLPRYYRSADLYVSASHSDGSSISLLEAMACGVPALVSDIPGNREWIEEGENGWTFPDGNPRRMCEAILRAAENRGRLKEMGLNARKTAEARADWRKNFLKLYEAYALVSKDK